MAFSVNDRPVLCKSDNVHMNKKCDARKKKKIINVTQHKNFVAFMNKSILALHDYRARMF